MTEGPAFAKGHGTGNDFVLLPDPDGVLDLTPARVQALCDRRFGIGGDGVLRVVRTDALDDATAAALGGDARATWFMDYRNADGTIAEMCGNGARVFARYLVQEGLAPVGPGVIGTRGGVLAVDVPDAVDGDVTVAMGTATTPRLRALPHVVVGERQWPATGVLCPNPHAVVFVDDVAEAGELREAPQLVPPAVFPDGANVEFVVRLAPGHIRMRVHERGVGETLSCGTGAVAAAWAARRHDASDAAAASGRDASDAAAASGRDASDAAAASRRGASDAAAASRRGADEALAAQPSRYRVDVPGGTVEVVEHPDGRLDLVGPAVIAARGRLDPAWWVSTS